LGPSSIRRCKKRPARFGAGPVAQQTPSRKCSAGRVAVRSENWEWDRCSPSQSPRLFARPSTRKSADSAPPPDGSAIMNPENARSDSDRRRSRSQPIHPPGRILREVGYSVLEARNGQEGPPARRKPVPILILLDVNLPGHRRIAGVSNPEIATAHRPRIPDRSCVRRRSFSDRDKSPKALDDGADGYLHAPL